LSRPSRFLIPVILLAAVTHLFSADAPKPLALVASGSPRILPARILGASIAPFFEHLLANTQKQDILKTLHLAFTRFPGGSDANYYDWRKGVPVVNASPNSSTYTKYWATVAPKIARGFPDGVTYEAYKPFNDAIGADVIFVPNLETSTIEEQIAWFKHLKELNIVPSHIELGNEFYIAMVMDPNVLKRWPNAETSMKIMREYREALRPYLPNDAKIAVQASPGSFDLGDDEHNRYTERLRSWDDSLRPETWFDAVTIHLYPRLNTVTGRADVLSEHPSPSTSPALFKALMAHADEGVDTVIDALEKRLPGKEIWVTEWSPRGASVIAKEKIDPVTPPMLLHLCTRTALALLRHDTVTVSLYFMFTFGTTFNSYVPVGHGNFAPLPVPVALGWLNEAANGGATFQRMTEQNASRIDGANAKHERYYEIEGGLFTAAEKTTLIIDNASAKNRILDLTSLRDGKVPETVEIVSAGALWEYEKKAATVSAVTSSLHIDLPAYSVARCIWK
jgi:hypothetical protein